MFVARLNGIFDHWHPCLIWTQCLSGQFERNFWPENTILHNTRFVENAFGKTLKITKKTKLNF